MGTVEKKRKARAEEWYTRFFKELSNDYDLYSCYDGSSHGHIQIRCKKCGRIRDIEARRAFTQTCKCSYVYPERRAKGIAKLRQNIENAGFITEGELPESVTKSKDKKIYLVCKRCGRKQMARIQQIAERPGSIKCDHGIKEFIKDAKKIDPLVGRERQSELLKKQNGYLRKQELLNIYRERYSEDFELLEASGSQLKLRCRECGKEAIKERAALEKGYGCGWCSKQGNSLGAIRIAEWLARNGYVYRREVSFPGLKRIRKLHFDFIVYEGGWPIRAIEFNGEQHYRATEFMGGEKKLKEIQEVDAIKEAWCHSHKMQLLIIKWDEDIEGKLEQSFE